MSSIGRTNSVADSVVNTISHVTSGIRMHKSTPGNEDYISCDDLNRLKQKETYCFDEKHPKLLLPLNTRPNKATVYSALGLFMHCKEHNRLLLSKGHAKWFPFVQEVPNHCWKISVREALPLILSNFDKETINISLKDIQFLEILRFQPPERLAFLTRVIFYIPIKSLKINECCKDTQSCKWYNFDDILTHKIDNIWGPEVFDWCSHINQICQQAILNRTEPLFTHRVFEFTYDNIIRLFKPYRPEIGQIYVIPPGSRCSSQDANRIFSDFLRHCYPAFGMTLDSFREYFLRYKLISYECRQKNNNRIERYFNAFNFTQSNNLSFEELLLGLCEVDYDKKHNNTRIAFIFRFYDAENKGYLNLINFQEMIIDLNRFLIKKKKAIPKSDISNYALITMNKFILTKFGNQFGVTQASFIEGVGKHVFRGTSNLCRSYNDIFQTINQGFAQKSIRKNESFLNDILKPIIRISSRSKCKRCRLKNYKLQITIISLRIETISANALSIIIFNKININENYLIRWSKYEIDNMQFTKESIIKQPVENLAYWIIKGIKEFNKIKFNIPGFMCGNQSQLLVIILKIFIQTLEPIFKSEKRCKPCSSPTFIIGDIHGNIEDLMSLEKTIWPQFPAQLVNYVFLGDYVDRGKWSVECALYLFAMKIISPYHVTLLRGNHEVRDIQCRYTYKKECFDKYTSTIGKEIFDLTNRLFDMLPLSAIIDETMFCCHGGLPECIDTIEEINRESNDIPYPEMDSLVAWQIMWADPLKEDLFNELLAETPSGGLPVKEGFIFNRKRGTAHWFNEIAFRNFCLINGLTHMTRAHEVPRCGFELMFDNRLATIFSCSHYCKNENDCGVLLLTQEKIRVIRIDTSSNLPAMDF